MISFPRTLDDAITANGELRAGGTDIQARRNAGLAHGPAIDLQRLAGLDQIDVPESASARIGAMVRIATLADDAQIQARYPALATAARSIATPQIRAVATIGGDLLQRTRCWYYRHPATRCYKKGGDMCPARAGNHLYGVSIDLGPCIAPHPSTLGMVLLAYDTHVERHKHPSLLIADLYGDGSNPQTDHQLMHGELLTGIVLPHPLAGERSAYLRTAQRRTADWPLVEVVVRIVAQDRISFAAIAVGGIANIPLRMSRLEAMLIGQPARAEIIEHAVETAVAAIQSLPTTAYKLDLLCACLIDAIGTTLG